MAAPQREEGDRKRPRIVRATQVNAAPIPRRTSGDRELDTILGGGFAVPSWVVLWGLAGAGKSRAAFRWATHLGTTLCCSLEMPLQLAHETAASAGAQLKRLHFAESVRPDEFEELARECGASVLLWDSISELDDDEGRELIARVRSWVRGNRFAIVICHATKDGGYRGPSTIGHAPDYLLLASPGDQPGRAEVTIRKSRFCGRGSATVPIVAELGQRQRDEERNERGDQKTESK